MIDPRNFDCIFRPASTTDYQPIHQLLHSCWIETYGPHVATESVRRFTQEDGVGEHLDLFLDTMQVAVIEDVIVGVINQFEGFITALYVARPLRGNRIGSSLLQNAYVAGGRYLEVAVFNTQAVKLYRRHRWKEVHSFVEDVFGTPLETLAMTRD